MIDYLQTLPDGGEPFDPYFVPDDWARLQYGRLLWKNPSVKKRLLDHWQDQRHPYSTRFERYRELVEKLLNSEASDNEVIDAELREKGHSLRSIMREIPPVFGSFY